MVKFANKITKFSILMPKMAFWFIEMTSIKTLSQMSYCSDFTIHLHPHPPMPLKIKSAQPFLL
jgi:hypothetical protein